MRNQGCYTDQNMHLHQGSDAMDVDNENEENSGADEE